MTSATLTGFLNKKEIEANYGRSYRSLTRDITKAVRSRDANILQHLKLVTDDEQIREGSDVTLDLIQELSNSGLRPMWLAEETWVAERCLKRSATLENGDTSIQKDSDPKPIVPTTNFDSQDARDLYQKLLRDLEKQNELLVGQLKIKDDQIRAANQQAEQSQQLMRDLHVLLKNVQDGLLGDGRPLIAPPAKARDNATQPVTVLTSEARHKPRPGRITSAKPTAETRPVVRDRKLGKLKKANDSRQPAKPTTKKQSRRSTEQPVQQQAGHLHRWFPTFLGSNRRLKK